MPPTCQFHPPETVRKGQIRYHLGDHYVPDKQMVTFLHAVIGFAIAIPFMHLFDSICDAVVYCN